MKNDELVFFRKIREYFNFNSCEEFWDRVLFFNFIPDSIGDSGQKYAYGSKNQLARGQARVNQLLYHYAPDKLLVFTRKGWSEFSLTLEGKKGNELQKLTGFSSFSWGTYRNARATTMAFGLQHPQYARTDSMKRAVRQIVKLAPTH